MELSSRLDHEFVEARIRLALGDVDGARRLLAGLADAVRERGLLPRTPPRYRRDLAELAAPRASPGRD